MSESGNFLISFKMVDRGVAVETKEIAVKMSSTPINETPVCIVSHGDQTPHESGMTHIEPAFRIQGESRLRIDALEWEHKAGSYLAHAVARKPSDLRSHVQRINLYLQSRDAEGVYGALLDLFITLADKGCALRERMLKISQDLLGAERHQALLKHLYKGISSSDAVPPAQTSVFGKGYRGTDQLVVKLESEACPAQDPREEASSYMEYGQIDEAQRVLEMAILDTPSRCELHYDLIEIYRSTHAKAPYLAMRQRISTIDNPVPEAWEELATYLGTGD